MAVDYFLKIDGIAGEADHVKHKDELGVESFSWGEYNVGYPGYKGGGYGTGKAKAGDFVFSLAFTKASPRLLRACATGQHIKKAVLTAHRAGKDHTDVLTWALEDARVTSYEVHADATAVRPREVVQLDAQRVQIEYRGRAIGGKEAQAIIAGWDFKQNKAITGDLTPAPKPKRKTKTKRRT
jgi:type VI secretion system secreted protein Hcp